MTMESAREAPGGRLCRLPHRLPTTDAEPAPGRPHGGGLRRPAGRRDGAGAVAGGVQGGGAAARPVAAAGACGGLAVPLHPAAGLGEGRAADRLALGLAAAGGARPVADAG